MSEDRSMSRELETESLDGQSPPGKPGRKKNPNSQAARRDQNRIAQREFRLRKQQKIRDLEARVEILSGGQDEALSEMRNILKDLMEENQTLRGMLRSLASFIGDGAGGLLPKLGWDMSDFTNFINRSETDTAFEGYQRRKKVSDANPPGATTGQKRSFDEDVNGRNKKARSNGDSNYNMLLPLNPPSTSPTLYSSSRTEGGSLFSDSLKSHSSGVFSPPPTNSTTFPSAGPSTYPSLYNPVNLLDSSMIQSTMPSTNTAAQPLSHQRQPSGVNQLSPEQFGEDDDPNKTEAYKLIHYHLDNFKRNSAYCLPASLRPTLVQKTVPHEGVIDRILHPELRDRMILLRGNFDLVDCLLEYRNSVTIHGDDVLAHTNWEIGEKWLRQYSMLVDPATLGIMNRWRRERGETELRLSDLSPDGNGTGPSSN